MVLPMAKVLIECSYCKAKTQKERAHVNRSIKDGYLLFCGTECFGKFHRVNKPTEQKKSEKRDYDKQYRLKNKEKLKVKKSDYFKKTYDPDKARIERKKRMPAHVEYCRRPEYRLWKKEYDKTHRAKKNYGEFWEAFLLTMDIREECLSRQSDYEIRLSNGTLSKNQRRKRDAITNSS